MRYAVSDIHGNYDLYIALIEKLNLKDTDTLYVLGDVIDRGPEPMKIMLDMMDRKNIVPLLGNHEARMLSILNNYSIDSLSTAKELSKVEPLISDWLWDKGETTIKEYCRLCTEDKDRVYKYLNQLQVFEAFEYKGSSFFLSHTAPYKDVMADFMHTSQEDFIWGEIQYDERYFEDGYLVTGHTPTMLIDKNYRGKIYKKNGHIAIDCGAFFTGTLGCICLDTLDEIYISREDNVPNSPHASA